MNILLTTSPAPDRSPFSLAEKLPPLGIGFLISVLKKSGHTVFFIDTYLTRDDFIESGFIQHNKIDIIGVSVNTVCFNEALKLLTRIDRLRTQKKWGGKLIVGGPHAAVAPETIPAFVDHIIQGEGEQAFLNVLEGETVRIIKSPAIQDLDSLPMPAWEEFYKLPYVDKVEHLSVSPVINMNTSRGCPFECTFCSVGSVWGRGYRTFSAERIVDDIQYVAAAYGVRGIYFREDNFTLQRKRVEKLCDLLLSRNLSLRWMCETRVDTVDEELLALMKRAGCEALYIGVESGSQRVLDFLKKGISLENVENVFSICRRLEIKTCASFIVGIPTETPRERAETIAFKQRLQPTTSWINVFVGIPRSPLYTYVVDNRLYDHIDECGLVYLPGHNSLVDQFYGGDPNRKISRTGMGERLKKSSAKLIDRLVTLKKRLDSKL